MRTKQNGRLGMTLIETVVAVALLSIILLAATVLFAPALKSTNQSNDIAMARAVSDTVIDYIKGQLRYSAPLAVLDQAGDEDGASYLYLDGDGYLVKKQGSGGEQAVYEPGFYSGLVLSASSGSLFTKTAASNLLIEFDVRKASGGGVLYHAEYTLTPLNAAGDSFTGTSGGCVGYRYPDYVGSE